MSFSRHAEKARILAGSFTDIDAASAGTAITSPSSALQLSPVAADREDAMRIRLWLRQLFAFLKERPALHGVVWGAAIAGALVLLTLPLRDRLNDPLRRLQLAHRPFEARLTGFAYAPLSATRGPAPESNATMKSILGELQARVARDRSPQNLQRLASAQLSAGAARIARELLEDAHRALPTDASILSDLAAAELADHRVADAAEHSAQALELDPTRSEAAFTWAASMERFSNRPAAIDAWKRYLILDPDSQWADEARTRLASLEQPRLTWAEEKAQLVAGADRDTVRRLVAKYPWRTRLRVLNKLLPPWAQTNDPALFALAHAMASERAAADPYLLDVVEHAGRNRATMVGSLLVWGQALTAYDEHRYADAQQLFITAERGFRAAGSPMAISASIFVAQTTENSGRSSDALARVEALEAQFGTWGNRYPSMVCDTVWLHGLIAQRTGYPALALDHYRRAQEAAQRSGEIEQELAAQQLIATALDWHGDPLEAEKMRIAALRASDAISADRDRMFGVYADVAYTALRDGRPRLAQAFANAQMSVAEAEYQFRANGPASDDKQRALNLEAARRIRDEYGADADIRRALAVLAIGRVDVASQNIISARTRAMNIAGESYRNRVLAEVDYTTGLVEQRRGDTRAAIAAFTSAIAMWNQLDFRLHTVAGFYARAEAYRSAGDRRAAEADYRAAINEMEAQRNGLEPELRIAHFERADRLFERLVDLLLEDGREADALTITERKRARVLLDQVAAGDVATPLDAEQIRAVLPREVALMEIALHESTVELWLVYDGRIAYARSNASRVQVEDAVTRHLAAIDAHDDAGVRREGRWLYAQLLAPLVRELPVDTTLVIVADGVLQALPFATLVTPDGQYLVQRFATPTSPSASVGLRVGPHSYDSLLAVAEPQPGEMVRLRNAEAEAKVAAQQHRRGQFASGVEMSPDEFLRDAGNVACVHFAGHAKTDVEHPSRSALLFESVSGEAQELTASEIGATRLPSAPLVVLAACSTGRGKLRRNEGIQSLAAAFLQAGARGVVGTLWDVDDALAARLFRSFHQQLRDGARPADALRSAQRALLRSPDPDDHSPYVWASAVVEGTY